MRTAGGDAELWESFDPSTLSPYVRTRKQIGRRWVSGEAASATLARTVGDTAATWLLDQVESDLSWQTGGELVPSAWRLCVLQSSSCYLVPAGAPEFRLHREDRHFDREMSADAAGLCATLFCLNRLGRLMADQMPFSPGKWVKQERKLVVFSHLHPEARAIWAVLD